MIERTPRRRRKLPRQRDAEFAGAVARIYRQQVAMVRAGKIEQVSDETVAKIRTLLFGEPVTDPKGRPSRLTESARHELLREFIANGMALEGPRG